MDWPVAMAIAAVLAAVLAVGLCLALRGPKKGIRLSAQRLAIFPLKGKEEWYVDVRVDFHNSSCRPISIGAVPFSVIAAGVPPLEAKRVLGDEAARHWLKRYPVHPPDMSLRFPINLPPGKTVAYRFHVFFSAHLRHYWNTGHLQLTAVPLEGAPACISIPLIPSETIGESSGRS